MRGLVESDALPPPVAPAATGSVAETTDAAVKAAFLFNFTKFTEWTTLAPGASHA